MKDNYEENDANSSQDDETLSLFNKIKESSSSMKEAPPPPSIKHIQQSAFPITPGVNQTISLFNKISTTKECQTRSVRFSMETRTRYISETSSLVSSNLVNSTIHDSTKSAQQDEFPAVNQTPKWTKVNQQDEIPAVNQTPKWTKLNEALELMKTIKDGGPIPMEPFEDEPIPIYGDSPIRDPATPRRNMTSTPLRRDFPMLNLEEPTYPESFFGDGKENQSGLNDSSVLKSSSTMPRKVYQMSRLGCIERRFAPDKAFYIEELGKHVDELRNMVNDLDDCLPHIDDVVAEYLIYDEVLIIPRYILLNKILTLDNDFDQLNDKKGALTKREAYKAIGQKLAEVSQAIRQVKDKLKLTSFTFSKFIYKKTDYLVHLYNTNPKEFEAYQKGVLDFKANYEDLKATYNQRVIEMTQEWETCHHDENRRTEKFDKKFGEIMQELEMKITNVLSSSNT